jgi:pyridoxine 4-dehydrogenase
MVAYSPLGRGFLTGKFQKPSDIPANDFRHRLPRFQPEVFDENLKLTKAVADIAKRKGVTSSQVALAWIVAQGALPIPGSTSPDRVAENSEAVQLSSEELAEIERILEAIPIQGDRYGADQQKYTHQ